ncbi:MAG: hypothetical protein K5647_05360 [Clostridiales bacterium]|nr:hypothetical protein [Clostridiales bacterium]
MNVFLSTPISNFKTSSALNAYKTSALEFISFLREKVMVCSEIETINNKNDYDSPEKSVTQDLDAIKNCDCFVLHYPEKIPTSALIELGFAIALEKIIIIITPKISMLPYLAQGVSSCPHALIIESLQLNKDVANKVINQIMCS